MAAFLDACRFSPTLGGTTDWTYSVAVTGYQSPTAAGVVNGTVYRYRAESDDLSQWEIGYGAYNTGTGVLARTTVLFNSSGGTSKINFTLTPQVAIVALKEDLISIEEANSFTSLQQAQARANIAVGTAGMTNRLINPNGQIWQRQNTGASAVTDDVYCFDRWYGLSQTAGLTASQVTNAENGTPYMMRLTQANAAAQRFGIAQIIENANGVDLRGQGVVLSARVRCSAATTLRYAIIDFTGTADTVVSDVVLDWTSATFTAGNFFTVAGMNIVATGSTSLSANTLTSISLAGTMTSSTNNPIIFFWTDSTQAQNVTLDIAKVQLEIGTTPTALALRSYAQEFWLCRRYYQKTFSYATAPAQSAGITGSLVNVTATTAAGAISFRVYLLPAMVAIPTLTTYNTNAANADWWDTNASASRSVSTSELTAESFRIVMNAVSTAGGQHFIHYMVVAEL